MLQLKLKADVHDSELLRRHIELAAEDIAAEIEAAVGDDVPISFVVKRIAKNIFGVDLHARLFGRLLVVSDQDTNLFQAVSHARRHLLRQIGDLKHQRLDKIRRRSSRFSRTLALANAT